jgi:nucleoside phosphorylase
MALALVAARREELAAVLRLSPWRPWGSRSQSAWRQRRAPEGALAYQRRDHTVSAILTGAGRAQTERAMSWLMENERPDSILSIGFAGACTPNLDVGDLVLATRLHHIGGSPFDWDLESLSPNSPDSPTSPNFKDSKDDGVRSAPKIHDELVADADMLEKARTAVEMNGIDFTPAPTLTVDSLVRTSGLSAWLGEAYGVAAVDRESYWVAAAAASAGVPCLSVRSIAYGVNETLPEMASRLPDTPSGGRFGPVFRHGTRHPRTMWRHMSDLRTARNAVATLTEVLTGSAIIANGEGP